MNVGRCLSRSDVDVERKVKRAVEKDVEMFSGRKCLTQLHEKVIKERMRRGEKNRINFEIWSKS